MKQFLKTALICTSLVTALTACVKPDDNKDKKDGDLARIQATKSMDASELADAGEQLMTPYTWMLADKVFTMALEKDPLNKKADLYKHALKPLMVYRGIAKRIKPFARQYGSIENLENSIAKSPNSPMKDFLLDGKEDITSLKQIQDVLVEQREAFNDFRKYLKDNSDMEITLNLNPYVWSEQISEKQRQSCKVIENGTAGIVVDCDYKDVAVMKVGSADAVAASQMMAGYVLMLDLYTSYSVEGYETVMKQLENPRLSPSQRQSILESVPTIGKLRADNKLSRVLEIGSDFAAAARWALKYQDRLCSLGEGKENRPGYAMSKGLCVSNDNETARSLALLEQGLKGAIDFTTKDKLGNETTTKVNYAQFFAHPAQDLRALAPNTYCERTGEALSLRDKTFNGLYPNGDAEKAMLKPCGNQP